MTIDCRKSFKRMRKTSVITKEEVQSQMKRVVAFFELQKAATKIALEKK